MMTFPCGRAASKLKARRKRVRSRPVVGARGCRSGGGGGPCAEPWCARRRCHRGARHGGRASGRRGRQCRARGDPLRPDRGRGRRRRTVDDRPQGPRHAPHPREQQPHRPGRCGPRHGMRLRGRRAVEGALLGARRRSPALTRPAGRRRGRQRTDTHGPSSRRVGGGTVIEAVLIVVIVILAIGIALAGASVRVLREYERAVVFRLGRMIDTKGPGLVLLMPAIDRMVRVSLRTVTLNVPPQDVITRDNVPARVDAALYFRVVDPNAAVVQVESFLKATTQIAQTTLRSVLGKADLDTLLSEREELNEELQKIIDAQTEPWGVKVSTVEIKDVGIPQAMQHAMARQAQAERERRAKVINAEGEFQAAARLAQAADGISQNPATMQLRYLQTLSEIGINQNTTVVFPLPMDLVKPLLEAGKTETPQAQLEKGANGTTPLVGDTRERESQGR